MEFVAQGAEGVIYSAELLSKAVIVKERISKKYRVPSLDSKINKQRILQEARCMVKCLRVGVLTPSIFMLDMDNNRIVMERIIGITLKAYISSLGAHLWVKAIGIAIGKMHDADIVHGDLTTSNMMLKQNNNNTNLDNLDDITAAFQLSLEDTPASIASRVVIIDFGLGMTNAIIEDKAVDLYVLERAFASTHPHSEELVSILLEAYRFSYRRADPVLKKLDQSVSHMSWAQGSVHSSPLYPRVLYGTTQLEFHLLVDTIIMLEGGKYNLEYVDFKSGDILPLIINKDQAAIKYDSNFNKILQDIDIESKNDTYRINAYLTQMLNFKIR
eukprot:gene7779-15915_t